MALLCEIYEKWIGGSELATNGNWKSASGPNSSFPYYLNPVTRPDSGELMSYAKVLYGKISGTYTLARSPTWKVSRPTFTNTVTGKTPVYHLSQYIQVHNVTAWSMRTNTLPSDLSTFVVRNGSHTNVFGTDFATPNVSAISPENATSVIDMVDSGVYYTDYIITQIVVAAGPGFDLYNDAEATAWYGNVPNGLTQPKVVSGTTYNYIEPSLELTLEVREYE